MIRAAAVLAAALTSAACSATRQEAGQVDHVVLLWLKAPGDRSALTRVEQTVRGFADQLPEPTSVTLGAPLLGLRIPASDSCISSDGRASQ